MDVIFAMDDETAQGAYRGYLDAGFSPDTVTVAGFGLSGEPEKEWLLSREALKVSQAMFPEYVGLKCIDAAVRLFDGQSVPNRDVIPTVSMTPELLEKYYPKTDGVWTPDLNVIAAIPANRIRWESSRHRQFRAPACPISGSKMGVRFMTRWDRAIRYCG